VSNIQTLATAGKRLEVTEFDHAIPLLAFTGAGPTPDDTARRALAEINAAIVTESKAFLDRMVDSVQNSLGVRGRDFAGMYFSGQNGEEIRQFMARHLADYALAHIGYHVAMTD